MAGAAQKAFAGVDYTGDGLSRVVCPFLDANRVTLTGPDTNGTVITNPNPTHYRANRSISDATR